MPRADYNQTVAIKQGIIAALRDNLSDEFTAKEIADALLYPPDVDGRQVGATLKLMAAEGLVAKRPYQNMNIYRLHKRALSWVPPLDDSREVAAAVKAVKAQSQAKPPAAGKVNGAPVLVPPATPARKKPKPPTSKPADNHPWVHPPAVTKDKPDRGGITRPLPVHLETPDPRHSPASPDPGALDLDDTDLAAMALPAVPIEPALGAKAFLVANPPHEASRQLVVDNCTASGQAILDDSSYSEIPNSSPTEASSPEIPDISNHPEIPDSSPDQVNCSGLLVSSPDVVEHEAPNAAQQTLPAESHEDEPPAHRGCGGHCANHAMASESEEAAHLQEVKKAFDWLDQKDLLIDQLTQELGDMEKRYHKLVDHLTDSQPPVTEQKEAVPIHLFNALQDQAASLLNERDALAADISNTKSALADALSDLAISRREQDRLHQQLREHDRQHAEDQNRIDALMDVARPHLAKGKHGDTARSAAPFGLPVIPKDWIGLLKLTLLDDNAKLVLKIDNEGGGAYATLKVDAALNQGEADFIPGLTNGLIGLLDYLLPHLAISPPDHFADTGNMVMTSEARP